MGKCYVNIDGFRKTISGKRKVWHTDGVITFCCSPVKCVFIKEKATKHNGYEPYSGYVEQKYVEEA